MNRMQTNTPSLAPFSLQYTANFPDILQKLKCTLALSTYEAGKVIFISALDENRLIQLPRTFEKAMGIAIDLEKDKLAIALKSEVTTFKNSKALAQSYPDKPGIYDSLFMPRSTYYTGQTDIHDLHWCGTELLAVNTLFSCIVKIGEEYSFEPVWKPLFISEIVSEDRCHLNGMAVDGAEPKYLTAFSDGNSYESWRDVVTTSGIVIDYASGEIITKGLSMPHSPKMHNGELYLLLSATGELVKLNVKDGTYDVVWKTDAFLRGMTFAGEFAFIGRSRIRKDSSTFAKLDISGKSNYAGVSVIHLSTGKLVAQLNYQTSVNEIYDVQIMQGITRPNILNTITDKHNNGITMPGRTLWAKEIVDK